MKSLYKISLQFSSDPSVFKSICIYFGILFLYLLNLRGRFNDHCFLFKIIASHWFATALWNFTWWQFPEWFISFLWNIKKVECWRIDAFELWCWRRLLRVPWTAKSSRAQSILKEIIPDYSLEELMLKLQYFGHLMQRVSSLEKTWCGERLKAGSERDNRTWDGRMVSLTQWAWVWASSRSWWHIGKPGVLQSMGSQSRTWLSDWIELNWCNKLVR